jgi:light-regulated signal transduction histidine kinase (bacteriophytochrome)
VTLTSTELNTVDLANCASEPIRIPGSIQPHGFLLVLDRQSLALVQASANVAQHLGAQAESLLGRPLPDLLAQSPDIARQIAAATQAEQTPQHLGAVAFATATRFELTVHRVGPSVIAEFEPASDKTAALSSAVFPSLSTFVARLQHARSIDALCELAVQEVRQLTGFGRVVAYSFDAEGHGRVNAEIIDDGYDSFLGLQFPASDIPAQARELYILNRIRVIQDAGYVPSPLVPASNPLTNETTDLGFASLRSVSPVHVRYMVNMGTQASMSISIVVENRLWGLISCHDARATPVAVGTRIACDLLGRILSLQIEAREAHADTERRLELRHLLVRMLSSMADHDSVPGGLTRMPDTFMEFARAGGAAIVSGTDCIALGETPDRATIMKLCEQLADNPHAEVFHTDSLGMSPEFQHAAEVASGVMAVSISELHANYLIWFRPQWVRTVKWAGEPVKMRAEPATALNPRQSFAAWQEVVRGQSRPWERAEIEGAAELRTAVLGIVLRKAEELAEMADELNRTNKELEAFSYSVSHDLRAPLRHIAGYAQLLGEYEGTKLSERGSRYLDNIGESARFAGSLVDSLLTFSQMGRSALRPAQIELPRIIEQIQRELLPDVQHRNITWTQRELPSVFGDAAYIHLALRNLISNAVKYTRTRDPAVIEIGTSPCDTGTVLFVRDNGVGFDMKYASKLFGVFQRLHRMEEFEGTGIGLANVRRIVERHGGKVWADGEIDRGATFYMYLPRADLREAQSAAAGKRKQRG